jgi:hypothetical protein
MPIDESKVKDLLINRPTFRVKIQEEIDNYTAHQADTQFEHGVLTYLNDATYGEMRDLVRDVGITTENIPFYNVGDL